MLRLCFVCVHAPLYVRVFENLALYSYPFLFSFSEKVICGQSGFFFSYPAGKVVADLSLLPLPQVMTEQYNLT